MAIVTGRKNYFAIALKYFIVALLTFIFIYPFWQVLIISLNDAVDLARGFPAWLPRVFSLANYEAVFRSYLLPRAVFLSVSRTVLSTALGLICNGMLAYSLTRRQLLASSDPSLSVKRKKKISLQRYRQIAISGTITPCPERSIHLRKDLFFGFLAYLFNSSTA